MKSGMKQVQVPPFELILCQDVATASRNPLECLLAPKTAKQLEKMRKNALRCSAAAQFTLVYYLPLWHLPDMGKERSLLAKLLWHDHQEEVRPHLYQCKLHRRCSPQCRAPQGPPSMDQYRVTTDHNRNLSASDGFPL